MRSATFRHAPLVLLRPPPARDAAPRLRVRDDDDRRVVSFEGELDIAGAGEFALALCERPPAGELWADLTATRFMDASGVHALLEAHFRLRRAGGRLAVLVRPGPVRRVLWLTGADDLLEIHEVARPPRPRRLL